MNFDVLIELEKKNCVLFVIACHWHISFGYVGLRRLHSVDCHGNLIANDHYAVFFLCFSLFVFQLTPLFPPVSGTSQCMIALVGKIVGGMTTRKPQIRWKKNHYAYKASKSTRTTQQKLKSRHRILIVVKPL